MVFSTVLFRIIDIRLVSDCNSHGNFVFHEVVPLQHMFLCNANLFLWSRSNWKPHNLKEITNLPLNTLKTI